MKAYTTRQYYTVGWGVYRNGTLITNMSSQQQAQQHADMLNDRYGDREAYELLNSIRDEITLYEDGDYNARTILESVRAMLDSRQKTIIKGLPV